MLSRYGSMKVLYYTVCVVTSFCQFILYFWYHCHFILYFWYQTSAHTGFV
jgi:hypothetical protein